VYAAIAISLFGSAFYADDDYAAHVAYDELRINVDDTMLTVFAPPVGILMSLLDSARQNA
jgi:hypothetical protein